MTTNNSSAEQEPPVLRLGRTIRIRDARIYCLKNELSLARTQAGIRLWLLILSAIANLWLVWLLVN